jgi:TldD protein
MSDLRNSEADFSRALARLEEHTPFAEILAQAERGEGVRLDRRSLTASQTPRLKGAVLRAWGGERWIEGATSSLEGPSIVHAADAVLQQLSKSTVKSPPPGEASTLRREWTERPARPVSEVGVEEMIALARDVLAWEASVPGVTEGVVSLNWNDEERFYLNTAGARAYQLLCRVGGFVTPIAVENGRVEFDYVSLGSLGGWDRFGVLTEASVTEVAREARQLLDARPPPTGAMSVLLDPGTAGTFAHESFGHGTEADQFLRDRSYLRPILGQEVSPEMLSIVDDGTHPDGWGTIRFDDEGRATQRTMLIDHGRFVGALHDRGTAAALHARPTGNARRSDFLSRLFVRMTNTYVEPGDRTFEELVEEAKNGVVLEHTTSGIEDPLGGQMQIKVKKGRRIENGQLTDPVTSMALSGKVLDVLRQMRGASRRADFQMTPGFCGKGHTDILPVGSGGVYLLSTAVVGPG